jgi:hypothetical protein
MSDRTFTSLPFGSPPRTYYLWQDPPVPEGAPPYFISGWGFAIGEFGVGGKEIPIWDVWEETYGEIIAHFEQWVPKGVIWVDDATGEQIDPFLIDPDG